MSIIYFTRPEVRRTPIVVSVGVILTCIFSFQLQAGETFIGPTSETNRFIIDEGELAVFSVFQRTKRSGSLPPAPLFIRDGVTNQTVQIDSHVPTRSAIAGPLEIVWNAEFLASFQRVQNSGAQTIFLNTSNRFEIPKGASVHIFPPLPYDVSSELPIAYVEIGFHEPAKLLQIYGGEDLYGPLSISFRSYGSAVRPLTLVITAPNSVERPQSFTGHLNLNVEKSHDLKTWQPAFLFQSSEIEPSFFRLSVVK